MKSKSFLTLQRQKVSLHDQGPETYGKDIIKIIHMTSGVQL